MKSVANSDHRVLPSPGDRQIYYLSAGVDGRVPGADHPAAPGGRLRVTGDAVASYLYVRERPEGPSQEWPVRLFRVTYLQTTGVIGAHSLRRAHVCRAVSVIDEIPAWRIFGERGATLARLIEQAGALDDATVARVPLESDRARTAWLTTHREMDGRHDWGPTTASYIVSRAVHDAARRSPRRVFGMPDYVDPAIGPYEEILTDPQWQAALIAAGHAVAGFAAKPFIDDERFRILTNAWLFAVGDPSIARAEPAASAR